MENLKVRVKLNFGSAVWVLIDIIDGNMVWRLEMIICNGLYAWSWLGSCLEMEDRLQWKYELVQFQISIPAPLAPLDLEEEAEYKKRKIRCQRAISQIGFLVLLL